VAYPDRDKGLVVVERLADGQKWEIDTQEHSLSFTPDSQGILWIASDDDAPSDSRVETLWLAEIDGSNARAIIGERRTSTLTWLPGDRLLMTRRFGGTADEQLFTLSLKDGSKTTLIDVPRMRGLALSRDRRYLVYYATFEMEAEKNGTWLIDLEKPEKGLQKLPFFGAYRWRDGERLIYIPFDSEATRHVFYEYNVKTGQTQRLLPEGVDLRIANNDWVVSPDGNKIALVAARGTALDGIWVVDIN
jgi:Tol biopolymer transport system component